MSACQLSLQGELGCSQRQLTAVACFDELTQQATSLDTFCGLPEEHHAVLQIIPSKFGSAWQVEELTSQHRKVNGKEAKKPSSRLQPNANVDRREASTSKSSSEQ